MTRKKFWMLAAILTCGLVVTSCVTEDNPITPATEDETQYADFPEYSPDDELNTLIKRPAYVFDGEYTGEGKAIVARATTKADLYDEKLEVIILKGSKLKGLRFEDASAITRVLAGGGTVVIVEPLLSEIDQFCEIIGKQVSTFLDTSADAGEDFDYDILLRMAEWSEESPFKGLIDEDTNDDDYEVIALRAKTIYASMNDREGVATKQTVNIEVEKENAEGEYDTVPVEVEYNNELDDHYFGKKAGGLAEWINSDEPEVTEEEAAEARSLMMTRAADAGSLQNLSKAQTFILDGSNNKLFFQMEEYGCRNINHPIKLRYDVWTAYSEDKKCDYYCVKLSVTAENNELDCGPSGEREWYNAQYDPLWKAANKDYNFNPTISSDDNDGEDLRGMYGPYMRELDINCSLDKIKPNIVDYTPKNSTSGGATVAETFSYSLGGNVGYGKSGPSIALTGNCTWGTSVSRFSPDLNANVTVDTNIGTLGFNYKAARPIAEYNFFKTAKHSGTKDISMKTCTVAHAWVWEVKTDASTVTLNTRFKSVDEWLTYYEFKMQANEVYLPVSHVHKFKSVVNCPARNKQEWTMTVEPANSRAEAYLASKLKNDFIPNGILWTRKDKHTSADTNDEISICVAKSKSMFNRNKAILKGAAQEGGIEGSYTIRWHQANGTGDAADDFTYEVKL